MINVHDILETIQMIDNENLDVRTITMGISLLDCCDPRNRPLTVFWNDVQKNRVYHGFCCESKKRYF